MVVKGLASGSVLYTSEESLRFAPAILSRLGEELVPNPDLGIIELVRNAYDADALNASVRLINTEEPGGSIEIRDDGCGMSIDDIRNGWLLLGQSRKTSGPFTPGGRRKIGEKGLGRLAALRLGASATLTTRESRTAEPGTAPVEHSVTLKWADFEGAIAVEEVRLDVVTIVCPPATASGTTIRIDGLARELTEKQIGSLARSLVLLNGAFPAQNTFRAVLDAPEFERLTDMVATRYFEENEYRIEAHLDADGYASAIMTDWRGNSLASANHESIALRSSSPRRDRVSDRMPTTDRADPYLAPEATFELWVYILGGETWRLRDRTTTLAEIRTWLKQFGGVHLFQRGLRVHPYGDEGHDWLDMNLRRVRSPEGRPSTNTSIGRVVVDDDAGELAPKTDRSGFVENTAFLELKRFCIDVLDWSASRQLDLREKEKKRTASRAQRRKAQATESVRQQLATLPEQVRGSVEQAFGAYENAAEEELKLVVDELKLYRTLSTVGTTTAVFAHETIRPLSIIEQMIDALSYRLGLDVPADKQGWYTKPIATTIASASSLRTFAQLPLRLLESDKRQNRIVDISDRVSRLLQLFQFYLDDAGVVLETHLEANVTVSATVSEIEAIIANLLANAVHFLSTGPTSDGSQKRVLIESKIEDDDHVSLTVADNGPGIASISPEDVWLPGHTTREGGTGLGLTIVRDVVNDLNGTRQAKSHGRLGGAEFRLVLPRTLRHEPEQLFLDET